MEDVLLLIWPKSGNGVGEQMPPCPLVPPALLTIIPLSTLTTLLGLIARKEPKTFQVCCIIAILYTDNTYKYYVAGLESRKLLLAVISA